MKSAKEKIHSGGLSLLAIAVASLILGCAPPGEPPEQMIAEAKALDQRFLDAYNKQDVDAVMATYWNSPDLVSFPPGAMEAMGWENLKQSVTKEFSETKGTLELLDAKYMPVGDHVMTFGKWRFTMSIPDGESMVVTGRYTDLKGKRDGKWVYVHDHASAPLPPPPAAQ